jgi:hypothetical protein
MAFLDDNGLLYFWLKLKNTLAGKVDKEDGKGLSSNDYSTTEKEKLAGIAEGANNYSLPTASSSTLGGIKVGSNLNINNGVLSGIMSSTDKTKLNGIAEGAQVNVIESVKVNGTALTASDKVVNITVPTNTNQLTNGAGYQTASQVQALIANAGHLKRLKVDSLPTTGDENTIYMVLKSGSSSGDVYSEYMYIDNAWELIGSSSADLSGYVQSDDTITNAEIDTIVAS